MSLSNHFRELELNLFNDWPEGLILLTRTGNILTLNQRAQEILGYGQQGSEQVPFNRSAHQTFCACQRSTAHTQMECPLENAPERRSSMNGAPPTSPWLSRTWYNAKGSAVNVEFRSALVTNEYHIVEFREDHESEIKNTLTKLQFFSDVNPISLAEYNRNLDMGFCNPAMMFTLVEHGFDEDGLPNALPDKLKHLLKNHQPLSHNVTGVEKKIKSKYYSWSIYPFEDNEQSSTLLVGYDITDIKSIQERENTFKKLIEEEQFRAYSKRLRAIAHELRSPLNAVVGYSNILKRMLGKDASPEVLNYLKKITDSGHMVASAISERLQLFSQFDSENIEPVFFDYSELLREVISTVKTACEFSISLEDNSSDCRVYADLEQVKKMVLMIFQVLMFANTDKKIEVFRQTWSNSDEQEEVTIFTKNWEEFQCSYPLKDIAQLDITQDPIEKAGDAFGANIEAELLNSPGYQHPLRRQTDPLPHSVSLNQQQRQDLINTVERLARMNHIDAKVIAIYGDKMHTLVLQHLPRDESEFLSK